MKKLRTALQAEMAFIWVSSIDLLNDSDIVEDICFDLNKSVGKYLPTKKNDIFDDVKVNQVTIMTSDSLLDVGQKPLYKLLSDLSHSLIVIDRKNKPCPNSFYNAGLLQPEKTMINDLISIFTGESTNELQSLFKGLQLKEIDQLLRIAFSRNSFNKTTIIKLREELTQNTTGIHLIDSSDLFYVDYKPLSNWINRNKNVFLKCKHKFLRPRGLLFSGGAGTGKTSGAKHLAKNLDIPLYRLDLSSLMTKWQGESESNLSKMLFTVENSAPCVVLIDEVEKFFSNNDDSGSTVRMMGQLLWWMQEHDSKVLTIMTTNDTSKLPPELYREGRIDKEIEFKGLTLKEVNNFLFSLGEHYSSLGFCVDEHGEPLEINFQDDKEYYSQSYITHLFNEQIKLINY